MEKNIIDNKRKVLVVAANGQLGSEVRRASDAFDQFDCVFVTRKVLDLNFPEKIISFFEKNSFDVIINCAAYTAVDLAESEVEIANYVNYLAVKLLAEIAKQKKIALIHISTDYVFDGKKNTPYVESDKPSPINVYGASKLAGENVIQKISPMGLIVRTGWVYSSYGSNFVKTMLRLGGERERMGVVIDQVGTPTSARDLALVILNIIGRRDFFDVINKMSICHYSNEGVVSWYDFASAIFDFSGLNCDLYPINSAAYPVPAQRPSYTVMNKERIKTRFDLKIPYWRDSLYQCMVEMKVV